MRDGISRVRENELERGSDEGTSRGSKLRMKERLSGSKRSEIQMRNVVERIGVAGLVMMVMVWLMVAHP